MSKTESDVQVLASHDFQCGLKMGLFMEVFYSPFDDEVLELFIANRFDLEEGGKKIQADGDEDYDMDDAANKRIFELNKYKSGKTIWVDLEPGHYTVQILAKRQPRTDFANFYEKVNFQLYMHYDFVNVPREAFLPPSLNFHGLLGTAGETRDFGHVTLLFDDLTLWHNSVTTTFTVESEIGSFAAQLEQGTDLIKLQLAIKGEHSDERTIVGQWYPEVSELGRIDTIELGALQPHATYELLIYKDAFSEHAHIEEVEMGERYGVAFSVKLDFSEFDESHVAANVAAQFRDLLPNSIE